jgi:nucleoside-diphosphate-sugar epimerase
MQHLARWRRRVRIDRSDRGVIHYNLSLTPMHVFLTGATGYVGSAVLDAFVRAGHRVTALVRHSSAAPDAPARPGVESVIGDLSNPASYVAAAAACDALVHTAFESSARGASVDRVAVEALMDVAARMTAAGRRITVIYTSSASVLGNVDSGAAEDATPCPPALVSWRPAHEAAVLESARRSGARAVVVRPGIVYGGAQGAVADLLQASADGLIRVVGDGSNRWPSIYDHDLADLYVRLAAHPDAEGVFHATDHADERVDDIVDAIIRHARTRPDVRHVPLSEARQKPGPYADALPLDQVVRSPRARAIGWAPSLHSITGNVARLLEEFRSAQAAA